MIVKSISSQDIETLGFKYCQGETSRYAFIYRPADIVKDIHHEYSVELLYHQAWHAKEVAIKEIW